MGFDVQSHIKVSHLLDIMTLSGETKAFIGFVLMPTFCWQAGQLWLAENMVLKSLVSQNLNLDTTALVLIKDKVDARDTRPLNLVGRVLCQAGGEWDPTNENDDICTYYTSTIIMTIMEVTIPTHTLIILTISIMAIIE